VQKWILWLPLAAALLLLAVSLPQRGFADAGVGAGASFGQGRASLSVFGGSGSAFSQTYFVLGVGANYYVIQGLGLGLFPEVVRSLDHKER
jgi:preprotein translocase subunit SecG